MRWKLWVGGLFVNNRADKKRWRAWHFVLVVTINKNVVKVERKTLQSPHKRRLGRGIAWPLASSGPAGDACSDDARRYEESLLPEKQDAVGLARG